MHSFVKKIRFYEQKLNRLLWNLYREHVGKLIFIHLVNKNLAEQILNQDSNFKNKILYITKSP